MVRRRSTVRFRNGAPQEMACEARSEAYWTALILRCGWELLPYWEESGRSPSAEQAAAAQWVRQQAAPVQRSKLLAALPSSYASVVRKISEAAGKLLRSAEFCDFLVRLDLSQTGTLDRVTLARAVREGAHQLTLGRGPDSARRLFDLVRDQAMPGRHRGITAEDVLAELAAREDGIPISIQTFRRNQAPRSEPHGGCDQPAVGCELYHLTHKADGGKASVWETSLY